MLATRRDGHHGFSEERTAATGCVHLDGHLAVDDCFVPELSGVIATPSHQSAVRAKCQVMRDTRRDGHNGFAEEKTGSAGGAHRHRRRAIDRCVVTKLTKRIITPGSQRAVRAPGHAVLATRRDGYNGLAKQ